MGQSQAFCLRGVPNSKASFQSFHYNDTRECKNSKGQSPTALGVRNSEISFSEVPRQYE